MTPVTIVAEVGSNFSPGELESALEMVHTAHECGADVVKFQDFRVDQMDRPDWWKEKCRPWEMSEDFLAALAAEAWRLKMGFQCSVWDMESAERGFAWQYPALKIAAGEIINQPLLRYINGIQRATYTDTGWNKPTQVWLSVDYRRHAALVPALSWLPDCEVTLLHCVSEYPADPYGQHWYSFYELVDYGRLFGLSSHFPYPDAVWIAVQCARQGAEVIEVHLRTEKTLKTCPDNGSWSLYPDQFKEIVEAVRKVE